MITIKSHGFKFSRPEANFIFDVSFLKNPWRDESIRNEDSREERRKKAIEFMIKQEAVMPLIDKIVSLLAYIHMFFPNENIQVAICCSAGEYRSPIIADMVAQQLEKLNVNYKLTQSENSKI